MKSLVKTMLLTAAAVICLGGQAARADSFPSLFDQFSPAQPFSQFHNPQFSIGTNTHTSFVWNNITSPFPTYNGSELWILDAQGHFLFSGNVTIPASVGNGLPHSTPAADSNIAVHVAPSGNSQLVFAFQESTPPFNVLSFGTWTFNAQGVIIASAQYGPFVSTIIEKYRV